MFEIQLVSDTGPSGLLFINVYAREKASEKHIFIIQW